MISLLRYFDDQVFLWHLKVTAVIWVHTCIVCHHSKIIPIVQVGNVYHLYAFVRFLTKFFNWRHLSTVSWWSIGKIRWIKEIWSFFIEFSEHSGCIISALYHIISYWRRRRIRWCKFWTAFLWLYVLNFYFNIKRLILVIWFTLTIILRIRTVPDHKQLNFLSYRLKERCKNLTRNRCGNNWCTICSVKEKVLRYFRNVNSNNDISIS